MFGKTSIRTLVLCALALALGVASLPLGEYHAVAQDAPEDPGAAACDVDAGAVPPTPSTGTPPDLDDAIWDYSAGLPADAVLVQALVDDRLATFLGCINSGDLAAASTLVTSDYVARHPFSTDGTGPASPLGAGETLTFTAVDAVRVHEADDVTYATVFVVLQDATCFDSDVMVAFAFRKVGNAWLVDDTAAVDGFDFSSWQPPGIRNAATTECDAVASIAGLRSLRQTRPEDSGMTSRPAQDVLADLEAKGGKIELENEEIIGLLDLKGVPSNKIRARNVRFVGGIDASLPLEVLGLESVARTGMDFYFNNVVFEGPVNFRLDQFDKLECKDCTFEGTLDLTSIRAENVYFQGTRFEAPVLFGNAQVNNVLEVSSSHFEGHAEFTGVEFGTIKFTHLTAAQPIQIRWREFGNRWLDWRMDEAEAKPEGTQKPLYDQLDLDLRFWQQNFSALGQGRDAREVYRERVELQRDHFHGWTDEEKWEAFYMGAGTAYGTEPYRAVAIVAIVVAWFAILYRVIDPFVLADPAAPDKAINRWSKGVFAVLFSIDAFVPFAVATGVKDAGWAVRGNMKWAVILERTLGSIATIALAYNVGAYLL